MPRLLFPSRSRAPSASFEPQPSWKPSPAAEPGQAPLSFASSPLTLARPIQAQPTESVFATARLANEMSASSLSEDQRRLLGPALCAWELLGEPAAQTISEQQEARGAGLTIASLFGFLTWTFVPLLLNESLSPQSLFIQIERWLPHEANVFLAALWIGCGVAAIAALFCRFCPLAELCERLGPPELSALRQLAAQSPAAQAWLERAQWRARSLRRLDLRAARRLARLESQPGLARAPGLMGQARRALFKWSD